MATTPTARTIDRRWLLEEERGRGTFGEVFDASDDEGNEVVVKVARAARGAQALAREVAMLDRVGAGRHLPRVLGHRVTGRQAYLVLEQYGATLDQVRRLASGGQLPNDGLRAVGAQMLAALEAIHGRGVVHRDVKPANIVRRDNFEGRDWWILIDFGLAKPFLDRDGAILPPRPRPGLRGSPRYASLESHRGAELSPRDDGWSLYYTLVEIADGSLPWRAIKDPSAIEQAKLSYHQSANLGHQSPARQAVAEHLAGLQYGDQLDFELMRAALNDWAAERPALA